MKATNPQLLTPTEALNQSFDIPDVIYSFENMGNEKEITDFDEHSKSQNAYWSNNKNKSQIDSKHFSGSLQKGIVVKSLIKRQGFRIGELNLMIRYEDGNELSEMPSVFPVPNAPHWFRGFSNLHGLIIPVFDLKKYFGFSETDYRKDYKTNKDSNSVINNVNNTHDIITNQISKTKNFDLIGKSNRPMLLVIQHHDNATGIVIDGLLERLEYEESCMQNTGLEPNQIEDAINGSYLINDEIWFDLDSLTFLNELETSLV